MRRVILTVQEIEFAFACRTFVLEMDPRAGNQIIIEGDALAVPNSGKTRRAFLNYGRSSKGRSRWNKFPGFSPIWLSSVRKS